MKESQADYINSLFKPLEKSLSRNTRIRIRQRFNFDRTQSPFLSGDSLAELADFVFRSEKKISKKMVKIAKQAKSLFVKSNELDLVDFDLFPKLKVLIAGNSDRNFDYLPQLPEEIRLLLLQNSSIKSDKVITLPIGLENRKLGRFLGSRDFKFDKDRSFLENRVLVPPMSSTNPIRPISISKAIDLKSVFDVEVGYISEGDYLDLVKRYRFLLCLEGNGYDSHRIWESLYLGVFPVLLKTRWSTTLDYLNLPILFINNLEEVNGSLLFDFATKHKGYNPNQSKTLWTPYWRDLIQRFSW